MEINPYDVWYEKQIWKKPPTLHVLIPGLDDDQITHAHAHVHSVSGENYCS